jgi:membrane-bound lytic murein transglycosylase D
VQRAIAKNQRAGLPTTYADLNMPMETRMYIPKLQAVKNIVASPDGLGVRLPDIPNHPYFQEVPITRDIDVELAAKLAQVSVDDFKALNPSANRPVILAAGTPQILLPWDNATVFQQNLEATTAGRLASWTAWIAPTTMKPADAARQVGMSEADFRAVNAIPQRMLVKAGSTLLVPRSASRQDDVTVQVADNAHLSLAPEVVLRKTLVKAKKADTVASIAKNHNVSASSVAEWNHIAANAAFKVGQQVVLFLPVQAAVARGKPVSHTSPLRLANHSAPKAAPAKVRLARR